MSPSDLLVNFGLVLAFILVGGVFAASEMAIVSLRGAQVEQIEAEGPKGARIAQLIRNPNTFLSAVQIGVTLAGFFSSAYGASTLAPALVPTLVSWGVPPGPAEVLAFVGMTIFIAYLSLVLGELAPKRLAMQGAVAMTRRVAPPLNAFANLMRPVIWLLSVSTNGVVRLLGGNPSLNEEVVSVEEIRAMVRSSDQIAESHRAILADVFNAAERTAVEVMRPRIEVDFLEGDNTIAQTLAEVRELPHSRYPVTGVDVDDVLGFVHLRDIIEARETPEIRLRTIVRPITLFPGTVQVLHALNTLRSSNEQIAIVVDEYGGTAGLVTLEDLLEELVGDIYDEYDADTQALEGPTVVEPGRFEIEGGLILQEFAEQTGFALPDNGTYQTVGGFIMARLGRIARAGDVVEMEGFRLRVLDVTHRRIGRVEVLVVGADGAAASASGEPEASDVPNATERPGARRP